MENNKDAEFGHTIASGLLDALEKHITGESEVLINDSGIIINDNCNKECLSKSGPEYFE